MMITGWYNDLCAINEVVGVSCAITDNGNKFNICHIRLRKDEVEILKSQCFENVESLVTYLKKNEKKPLSFHLEGRGVLVKEIPKVEILERKDILSVFPSYDPSIYLYSYFKGHEKAWLALVKRITVEELLEVFWTEDWYIARVYLGPFVVDNILEQLNSYSGHFLFDGHYITRDMAHSSWTSYQYEKSLKSKFSIKAQGMDLAENHVLAYATAFSFLMHRFVTPLHIQLRGVENVFNELLDKGRFRVNSWIILIGFFILLLINALLFLRYSDRLSIMDFRAGEIFADVAALDKHYENIQRNDSLLIDLGWSGGIAKSWIINQIVVSLQRLDKGIKLQEVVINPVASLGAKEIVDNRFRIEVKGTCRALEGLENWVRALMQMAWVETVEISRFMNQTKPNSRDIDFVLIIAYGDDLEEMDISREE